MAWGQPFYAWVARTKCVCRRRRKPMPGCGIAESRCTVITPLLHRLPAAARHRLCLCYPINVERLMICKRLRTGVPHRVACTGSLATTRVCQLLVPFRLLSEQAGTKRNDQASVRVPLNDQVVMADSALRVLLLDAELSFRGSSLLTLRLARGLERREIDTALVCTHFDGLDPCLLKGVRLHE